MRKAGTGRDLVENVRSQCFRELAVINVRIRTGFYPRLRLVTVTILLKRLQQIAQTAADDASGRQPAEKSAETTRTGQSAKKAAKPAGLLVSRAGLLRILNAPQGSPILSLFW